MKWSEQHKLPLNVEKSSHISMSNSMLHISFPGTLNPKIHIQKNLGVYVTKDLKEVFVGLLKKQTQKYSKEFRRRV